MTDDVALLIFKAFINRILLIDGFYFIVSHYLFWGGGLKIILSGNRSAVFLDCCSQSDVFPSSPLLQPMKNISTE